MASDLARLDTNRFEPSRPFSDFFESMLVMNPVWSSLKARIDNRLARHLHRRSFRLNNKSPMVSFTFDDAPVSAVTTGAEMIEEFDARGTYYVAGGLADTWSGNWTNAGAADIVRLHRKGHEIGCHTFSHTRTTDVSAAEMAAEIERNRSYLEGLDASIRIENFAFPFGMGSWLRKRQLGNAFRSSRGILGGVNSGTVDLLYLNSMPLTDREIDCDKIDRAFDEALEKNGWLIFFSHDVAAEPSPYGCSPRLLRHALEAAARRKMTNVSVADALRLAGA
jgi:peptidoglycan/xylan/chitin deacetylase (PgdA/CDA1 family)